VRRVGIQKVCRCPVAAPVAVCWGESLCGLLGRRPPRGAAPPTAVVGSGALCPPYCPYLPHGRWPLCGRPSCATRAPPPVLEAPSALREPGATGPEGLLPCLRTGKENNGAGAGTRLREGVLSASAACAGVKVRYAHPPSAAIACWPCPWPCLGWPQGSLSLLRGAVPSPRLPACLLAREVGGAVAQTGEHATRTILKLCRKAQRSSDRRKRLDSTMPKPRKIHITRRLWCYITRPGAYAGYAQSMLASSHSIQAQEVRGAIL